MNHEQLNAFAEAIIDSVIQRLLPTFRDISGNFQAGSQSVQALQDQLHRLSAAVDSLERETRNRFHAREDEEDEVALAQSIASQQEELDAELNRVASAAAHHHEAAPPPTANQDRTAATPPSVALLLDPEARLDIKYVSSLVSQNVPVFKTAGSTSDAKQWLNAAWSARETLSKAGQPPAADTLFAASVANRLQGDPHQWYRYTFLKTVSDSTNFSTSTFLSAFEQRFILSRHVQQAIRTQFLDLPSQCAMHRWSLSAAYDRMTQLLELMPADSRTSVPDQITLLMKCVHDDDVRRDANSGEYTSLEEAYQAIQKAIANRSHNRTMCTAKPRPIYQSARSTFKHSTASPEDKGLGRKVRFNVVSGSPPPTPTHYQTPTLAKLTPEERSKCVREGLCFRCREPGHSVSNCPLASSSSKNRNGSARP
jgi:hypothetical protein